MEIKLQRIQAAADFSLGTLTVNSEVVAFTLEDEKREKKVHSETRIPQGRYKIKLRTAGRIHEAYKKKFPWHKGVLWIQSIPGFEYVYLHIGNTDEDTAGCPLVGLTATIGKNMIQSSTVAYEAFYKKVLPALEAGQEVYITVIDEPV